MRSLAFRSTGFSLWALDLAGTKRPQAEACAARSLPLLPLALRAARASVILEIGENP